MRGDEAARATSVPGVMSPATTSWRADAVDRRGAERADEPERDEEHPAVHRRADARVAHRRRRGGSNVASSRSRSPNSLTSIAPETLKRSVICVFIAALCSICSREMSCRRRPTRRAGMMNSGSTTSASSVSRHSRASIAMSVVISTMTLLTTLPSVLVTAVWAPITSLLSRLMIAPVCVRVKNAIGMRCTLANSARRRS